MMQNMVERLYRHAKQNPNRTALILPDGKSLSFQELLTHVQRTRENLKKQGFQMGDRILIFFPVSAELIYLVLALFSERMVPVLIDPRLEKSHWRNVFKEARIKAIISNRRILCLRWIWWWLWKYPLFSINSFGWGVRHLFLNDFSYSVPIDSAQITRNEDEVLLTLTSGTTGLPKIISRKFGVLMAQQELACKYLPPLTCDIHLPLYGVAALQSIVEGATTILAIDHSPKNLVTLIEKHQVTRFSAPPRSLSAFFEYMKCHPQLKLPNLKNVLTGGAPIPQWMMNQCHEFFPEADLDIIYGSSECEPISHKRVLAESRSSQAPFGYAVGKIIDELEIQKTLFFENDQYKVFELSVKGPNCVVPKGQSYWATGDLIYELPNGEIQWVGRKTDAVRGVPSGLIEERLERISMVRRAAVLEIKSQVHVFIECFKSSRPQPLKTNIQAVLQDFGLPLDQMKFLESLPVDARHGWKILRNNLRMKT